ncbi:hypothetical protein ISN76_02230 [Dyella halodurans]|uniref:FimV N-terminal domain-containing protein n=1 Tax=Dyella halodurans TaxID=1920171 RepID=A0ABV9BZC7_9GAMM|nr:hypothetical protein [Dyella halodurans]
MNKVPAICMATAVSALLSGPLPAADLGQARVRSYRGQIVVIDVPLVMEGKGESSQLKTIATGSITDATGSGEDHALGFSHEIRRYESGQHFVRLTSTAPVEASRLTVWMMVESPYGKASRTFQLKMPVKPAPKEANADATADALPAPTKSAKPAPRVTANTLAAMNARLDEETRRITALVQQQRQALAAQASLLDRQRAQLAAIDRQRENVAAITAAAQAQLEERGNVLRGLSSELNSLLGTPDNAPVAAPESTDPDQASSMEAVSSSSSAVAYDRASEPATGGPTAASPLAPSAPSTPNPAPASGTPRAATRDAATPAIQAVPSAVTTTPHQSSASFWIAIATLTGALAGSVYLHVRARPPRREDAARWRSGEPSVAPARLALYGLDAARGSGNDPGALNKPLTGAAPMWIDASGLTDSLLDNMRRSS